MCGWESRLIRDSCRDLAGQGLFLGSLGICVSTSPRELSFICQGVSMNPEENTTTEEETTTEELLVEEVSIDGLCGVY